MNEVTMFTLENGNYLVLDKLEYQNHLYLYLFKEDDPEDVLIKEYVKDENVLKAISKETFDLLLTEFAKRHSK